MIHEVITPVTSRVRVLFSYSTPQWSRRYLEVPVVTPGDSARSSGGNFLFLWRRVSSFQSWQQPPGDVLLGNVHLKGLWAHSPWVIVSRAVRKIVQLVFPDVPDPRSDLVAQWPHVEPCPNNVPDNPNTKIRSIFVLSRSAKGSYPCPITTNQVTKQTTNASCRGGRLEPIMAPHYWFSPKLKTCPQPFDFSRVLLHSRITHARHPHLVAIPRHSKSLHNAIRSPFCC